MTGIDSLSSVSGTNTNNSYWDKSNFFKIQVICLVMGAAQDGKRGKEGASTPCISTSLVRRTVTSTYAGAQMDGHQGVNIIDPHRSPSASYATSVVAMT